MKKFVVKHRKKISITIVVCALLGMLLAGYTFWMISKNLRAMNAVSAEQTYYFPDYPKIDTTNKDAALIQKGEYLVKAGDCIACHTNTPKKGIAFAGGLPMVTPFGTIYSPNITPDEQTGIGGWTQEQFNRAMRDGVSPEGHFYFPAFPYYYFNKVTDEDLVAIKAYLDSLPPVKQIDKPSDMVAPLNFRVLQFGWRMMFFNPQKDTGVFKKDPNQSELWNRGAYLVEGLGHCAMCHSPSYHIISESLSLGAPIKKYSLTGARIQGYLAPNISHSNLGTVSEQDIIDVFTKDKMIGGGTIEGPMKEVNHNSLRYLTQNDLLAIATYLKNVKSELPPVKSSSTAGEGTYDTYCAGCHATGAGGAPKFGDAASWAEALKKPMDTVYHLAITGINAMPAKGTCLSCTDEQIKQAVDYMVNSTKGGASAPTVVPRPKPLTLEDGKRLYEENCGVCHETRFKGAPKPGDEAAWRGIVEQGFLETFENVATGQKGHPPHGACEKCSDAELKAAVKYMMQQSTTKYHYELW